MTATLCLNMVRHPAIPVLRGAETYEQWCDPAFWAVNDDINPVEGPAGVAAAVSRLLLDPGRPLHIRHSPTRRTRKGAELFAGYLGAEYDVRIEADSALAELDYERHLTWTREEHESPTFRGRRRLERLYRPMLVDDDPAFPAGHQRLCAAVANLRRVLATEGLVNHLWVSHGLVMGLLRLGVVENVPASEWTMERIFANGVFDYAAGFHLRVPVLTGAPAID